MQQKLLYEENIDDRILFKGWYILCPYKPFYLCLVILDVIGIY